MLPCAPAWRLPTGSTSTEAAHEMLAKRLDLGEEIGLTAVAGAYFSSLGITTERVYPWIADASALPNRITESLVFCRLSDVLARAREIADGHLLVAASRAGHHFAGTAAG